MNLRLAREIKVGSLVRESWTEGDSTQGIILEKAYVMEDHIAKSLGAKKKERYDFLVHWINRPSYRNNNKNPEWVQNWQVMLVSAEK